MGKCIKIVCQPGYKLNSNNICFRICNIQDEKWDNNKKECVKTWCPHGYRLKRGRCLKILCPAGYKLSTDNTCVKFVCDAGWVVSGNKCIKLICKEGFEPKGHECVPKCNADD